MTISNMIIIFNVCWLPNVMVNMIFFFFFSHFLGTNIGLNRGYILSFIFSNFNRYLFLVLFCLCNIFINLNESLSRFLITLFFSSLILFFSCLILFHCLIFLCNRFSCLSFFIYVVMRFLFI